MLSVLCNTFLALCLTSSCLICTTAHSSMVIEEQVQAESKEACLLQSKNSMQKRTSQLKEDAAVKVKKSRSKDGDDNNNDNQDNHDDQDNNDGNDSSAPIANDNAGRNSDQDPNGENSVVGPPAEESDRQSGVNDNHGDNRGDNHNNNDNDNHGDNRGDNPGDNHNNNDNDNHGDNMSNDQNDQANANEQADQAKASVPDQSGATNTQNQAAEDGVNMDADPHQEVNGSNNDSDNDNNRNGNNGNANANGNGDDNHAAGGPNGNANGDNNGHGNDNKDNAAGGPNGNANGDNNGHGNDNKDNAAGRANNVPTENQPNALLEASKAVSNPDTIHETTQPVSTATKSDADQKVAKDESLPAPMTESAKQENKKDQGASITTSHTKALGNDHAAKLSSHSNQAANEFPEDAEKKQIGDIARDHVENAATTSNGAEGHQAQHAQTAEAEHHDGLDSSRFDIHEHEVGDNDDDDDDDDGFNNRVDGHATKK